MKTLTLALVITALAAPAFGQDAVQPPAASNTRTLSPGTPALAIAPAAQPAPPTPPRAPQPAQAAAQAERETPPPPPPAPPPPAERRPLPTRNVKVDVTIVDQGVTAAPLRKVISMVIADGRYSQVRSTTAATSSSGSNKSLPLYIDVTPMVTPDQKVFLELRLQYAGLHDVADSASATGRVTRFAPDILETWNVLLTPGTALMVARAADAATDRTVTVEVKAEILK